MNNIGQLVLCKLLLLSVTVFFLGCQVHETTTPSQDAGPGQRNSSGEVRPGRSGDRDAGCGPLPFYKYYQGRTLHLSVVSLERLPELIWPVRSQNQVLRYASLQPSNPGLERGKKEFVVVRLKVENHKTATTIIDIDRDAVELRRFDQDSYFLIDPVRTQQVQGDDIGEAPIPRRLFLWGRFQLDRGMGIEGVVVFEAPVGTKFRDLRWHAGDEITIRF